MFQLDNADDVEITFEEVDDQCSDIGCIEKEGVDFHIESRETIDLSDKVMPYTLLVSFIGAENSAIFSTACVFYDVIMIENEVYF